MNKIALLLPAFALLAACGDTGEDAEIDMTTAPTEVAPAADENSLPAPDQETLAGVFDAQCEGPTETISTAICKRALGSTDVTCEFGVGEDDALRHEAQLQPNEAGDAWVFADPETVCAEHGGHHVDQ